MLLTRRHSECDNIYHTDKMKITKQITEYCLIIYSLNKAGEHENNISKEADNKSDRH